MKLILGGGISGLSAAHYLLKSLPASEIYLVEATDRFGGWIKSKKQPDGGAIFELGPHTIRPKGAAGINTLELIEELNLSSQVIPINADNPAAKNRMIYVNNKLHYLPSTIFSAIFKRGPFTKPLLFSAVSELFRPVKLIPNNDESIYDFIERRFGKDIADYAISPMICGICAGDAKEISVNFLMQSLFELEQRHGGIIKGTVKNLFNKKIKENNPLCKLAQRANHEKWSVYSIDNGLETLPLTLANNLQHAGVHLIKNSPCTSLEFYENNVFGKFKEHSIVVDHVICSLLAKTTGQLVEKQHPQLAEYLYSVPTVTVGVVNLQFSNSHNNNNDLINNAFGFLVPPSEKIPILGILFDSCCFPNTHQNIVLTVMMGGKWFHEYFGTNPTNQSLLDTSIKYVKNILNVNDQLVSSHVSILKDCIPQYVVGHNEQIQNINKYIQKHRLPISLCGSSYNGVGVNDVILSAKKAVAMSV